MWNRQILERNGSAILATLLGWLLLGPSFAWAQNAVECDAAKSDQTRLEVNVRGMRNTRGNITITIYPDDAAHFLDGAWKVARQTLPVSLPLTHACFVLPMAGHYAVAMFHDENDNHHFDTNMFGIPVEGWGFSNDPKLFVGPPKLAETRIAVHEGSNTVAVQMRYW